MQDEELNRQHSPKRKSLFPELKTHGLTHSDVDKVNARKSDPSLSRNYNISDQPLSFRSEESLPNSTITDIPLPKQAQNANALTKIYRRRKYLFIAAITTALAVTALVIIILLKQTSKDSATNTTDQNIRKSTSNNYTIPIFSLVNLPPTYTYNNDFKSIKTDVYYSTVTGPKKELYYITQQLIPANFDFIAFNKKFQNPDTFSTTAGTAIVGPIGGTIIGSVRTNKNTWILVNSSETATSATVETVIRSLDLP